MSAFVYLLSHYHEHGSEDVIATLDRARLPRMLEEKYPGLFEPGYDEAMKLQELLSQTDDTLSDHNGHNLSDGWGGVQLHVVRLDHIGDPV